ncbi:hypothetical protein J1N35_013658 [Gossypium stocksii]|uniref:Uncharacterized protein n=1 Tax=Gossypium stocksii TaxID=47602 RepID=A0A9D3VSU8_9ROSI|nr:hypothetical protein J1N35_013658 [Gossypium stocksii]
MAIKQRKTGSRRPVWNPTPVYYDRRWRQRSENPESPRGKSGVYKIRVSDNNQGFGQDKSQWGQVREGGSYDQDVQGKIQFKLDSGEGISRDQCHFEEAIRKLREWMGKNVTSHGSKLIVHRIAHGGQLIKCNIFNPHELAQFLEHMEKSIYLKPWCPSERLQ